MHNIPIIDLKRQYATIKDEVNAAIQEVLDSQWFILGPKVKTLEEEIAAYSGTKHAIGVASGSDAILLSMQAIGIGPGDEVITTAYSFFSTASSVTRLGGTPVFVDIDPRTFNIDPALIEEKITSRTRAIEPVHLFGQCADMDPILEVAREHDLKVIEDAAQAIGAEYRGRRAGSMGDLGCFSFFPTKNLGGCGDGGMVVTDDDELAEKIRVMRVHGGKPKYFYSVVGANSRLDALQAAILSVKFKYLDEWSQSRQEHAVFYDKAFKDVDEVVTPWAEPFNRHIYNQYTIRVNNRDELGEYLKEQGIGWEIYYPLPLHLQACYKDLGYKKGDFPESERAGREAISLPVFPELTEEEQGRVVEVVKAFYYSRL